MRVLWALLHQVLIQDARVQLSEADIKSFMLMTCHGLEYVNFDICELILRFYDFSSALPPRTPCDIRPSQYST